MSDDTQSTGAGSNEPGVTQTTDGTQTTAAAGEGTKPTEGTTPAGEGKAAEGTTPEEVTFKAEMPEGVELDQASLTEFEKIVKDRNLKPSEQAQKLIDLAIKREQDRAQAFAATVKGWTDTVTADPELGKAENLAAARKVIDTFGTPELKSMLESTGMGSHPEVVRFVQKVSKAMGEDAIVRARGDAPAPKSAAEVLYGNTPN